MERSGYWQIVAQCRNKENRGWWPSNLREDTGGNRAGAGEACLNRGLSLESYLEAPTFLRQGRRLTS